MDGSVSKLLAAQAWGPGFDAQLLHERLGMGAHTWNPSTEEPVWPSQWASSPTEKRCLKHKMEG